LSPPSRIGWSIGTRYTGGEPKGNGRRFRFARPVTPTRPGLYYQPGYGFNARSVQTFAGTAFLRHARAVLAQLAASRRELAAMQSLEVGQLAIGAPAMVAGHLLPPLIDGFLKQRPGLRLTIVQAGAEEIGGRIPKFLSDSR